MVLFWACFQTGNHRVTVAVCFRRDIAQLMPSLAAARLRGHAFGASRRDGAARSRIAQRPRTESWSALLRFQSRHSSGGCLPTRWRTGLARPFTVENNTAAEAAFVLRMGRHSPTDGPT